nr:hypothetical protein [Methylorubrum aminovorans]
MLPPLARLRTLRAARHLPDGTSPSGKGDRGTLGPVQDARGRQANRDPFREMRPHRLHQVAGEHVLHRAELGELTRPLSLAHGQVRAGVPALQHRLRARREAVGDEFDRQVGLLTSANASAASRKSAS